MACEETHVSVAADLRIRAGSLRDESDKASDAGEATALSVRIVGYEIAAGLHGIAAALYQIADGKSS